MSCKGIHCDGCGKGATGAGAVVLIGGVAFCVFFIHIIILMLWTIAIAAGCLTVGSIVALTVTLIRHRNVTMITPEARQMIAGYSITTEAIENARTMVQERGKLPEIKRKSIPVTTLIIRPSAVTYPESE
jgi:hypothetical protein